MNLIVMPECCCRASKSLITFGFPLRTRGNDSEVSGCTKSVQ